MRTAVKLELSNAEVMEVLEHFTPKCPTCDNVDMMLIWVYTATDYLGRKRPPEDQSAGWTPEQYPESWTLHYSCPDCYKETP